MLRRITLILLATALLSPLAEAAPGSSKADTARNDAAKADTQVKLDYVLQPSDLIKIQVFREKDLDLEVRISKENSVNLPLIGKVDLTGKTAHQAEELIRSLYDRDYLVNPQVNLSVLEYVPRNVLVLGSVGKPGVIPFPHEQGLTLLDAISRAEGFIRLADKKHVTLKRTTTEGESKTYTIDCENLSKGDTTETWPLLPNDVITVPERIL